MLVGSSDTGAEKMSKHNYYTYFEGFNKDGVAVYSGNSSFYTEPSCADGEIIEEHSRYLLLVAQQANPKVLRIVIKSITKL